MREPPLERGLEVGNWKTGPLLPSIAINAGSICLRRIAPHLVQSLDHKYLWQRCTLASDVLLLKRMADRIIFIIDMDLKMAGDRLAPGIVWRIGKFSIASYSTGTFCLLARYFFYWSPERVKDSFLDSLELFLAFLVFNALFSLAFYLVYKKAVKKAGKNLSGGKGGRAL